MIASLRARLGPFGSSSSRLLLGLLVLVLLWLALRNVSWGETIRLLRQIEPTKFVQLVALNGLILFAMSARWWLFLRAQGHNISYFTLFRYRLASFGVSYFTPGPHFGGEPLQVYLVKERHQVDDASSIAAVTLDKLIDLLFNFTFLAGGLAYVLQRGLFADQLSTSGFGYALFLLALPMLLLFALNRGWHPISGAWRSLTKWWHRFFNKKEDYPQEEEGRIWQVIRSSEDELIWLCRQRPKTMAAALAVSLGMWILLILEFWLAAVVLDLGLGIGQAILVMVVARVAILLPLPAGLGALEAGLVLAMGTLGLSPAAGISLGVLIRGRDVLVGLVGLWLGSLEIRAISRSRVR